MPNRRSNQGTLPPTMERGRAVTYAQGMAAFDALPPVVRRVLREATFDLCAVELLTAMAQRRPNEREVLEGAFSLAKQDEQLAAAFRRSLGMWW